MMSKRIQYFLLYIAAIIGVLSYQPFDIWPFSLVSIALVLYALRGVSPKRAFWMGYLYGVIFYIALLYWIAWATFVFAIPVPFILAFIPALFFWMFNRLERINRWLAVIAAPFIWVFFEYIRTLSQLAFPWNPMGNCFAAYPAFIQYAEYSGVYGISLWVLIINMIFYRIFVNPLPLKRTLISAMIIIILVIAPYIYGASVIPDDTVKGDLKVALLQGNIPRDIKWDPAKLNYSFDTYFSMIDTSATEGAELIILPETALPCYLRRRRPYIDMIRQKVAEVDRPVLAGAPDYVILGEQQYVYYNSAQYYMPGRRFPELFYKNKLVPFSERIPFSGKVKVLREIRLGQADFSPGDSLALFEVDGKKFGTLICFEIVFPDLVRRFVNRGADFMVTITNDMWFGVTSGPYQHYYNGTLRAVENRVGIVRCANTGISLFYDPYGRTYTISSLNERRILIDTVATKKEQTFYNRHGDYIARISMALTFLAVAVIISGTVMKRRTEV
ncbi:MAG: apolipoprotein N-acyltransferase [candidate division Zixibacteria bacterium]|nr:apolipoprotein N-acyltransferase [candidate division Zixibacteria bacterium]